jgi:hypothetical protein
MKNNRVLARDQVRIAATLLGLQAPFVRQVTTRMKSDGRLPATRPVATAVTPQSFARLILGLCTILPSKSTELEMTLGALPRVSGDGAETAALELENLIAEAVGIVDGEIDFWRGDLLIGVTSPVVGITITKRDGSTTFRSYRRHAGEDDRFFRFVRLPLNTLRAAAFELIGEIS